MFQETVKLCKIEVQWADKANQIADPLTKYGASAVHVMDVPKCRKLCGKTITKVVFFKESNFYVYILWSW